MTAPIVKVMVANKLPATVLAQVFLLVIAGFAVSLYILPTATGTANGILSFHTSNIAIHRKFQTRRVAEDSTLLYGAGSPKKWRSHFLGRPVRRRNTV